MDSEKTGRLIANLRGEKGLTQKELAARLGVTGAAVSKWENGKGFPDISLLEPLSQALDVSITALLSGERDAQATDPLLTQVVDLSVAQKKRRQKLFNWILAITVAALYLFVSFLTQRWELTWVLWLVYCLYRFSAEFILKKGA